MKKILENMDSASSGNNPAAEAEVGSMKAILESINDVNECGMTEMPGMAPMAAETPVTMNVTLNAQGTDAIADLITLMGGHKSAEPVAEPAAMPAAMPSSDPHADDMDDMRRMISISADDEPEMVVGGDDEPDIGGDEEPESNEEFANAPDEKYADHNTMTKDLSGGINRQKKSYKPAAGGDNPMAKMHGTVTKESIKETLWAALSEKKTTEGRGKKKLKASRGNEDIKATEGSRGKKSRGKKSRG